MPRSIQSTINYNIESANEFGWTPAWFGCSTHDVRLVEAIVSWQMSKGLSGDGLVGSSTFRRLRAEKTAKASYYAPTTVSSANTIICDGYQYPIRWDNVIRFDEPDGLHFTMEKERKAPPISFISHWDVCFNSHSCFDVLNRRGLSVHFMIDNDGTIYQAMDPQYVAWHAKGSNFSSIGVEIANAYYPKYANWYAKNGFPERPLVEGLEVHGQVLAPFTGFYDVQVEAYTALAEALHIAYNIPLETPTNSDGSPLMTVDPVAAKGNYSVYLNHLHVSPRKTDAACLDLVECLGNISTDW
jgi:hypothetical protein